MCVFTPQRASAHLNARQTLTLAGAHTQRNRGLVQFEATIDWDGCFQLSGWDPSGADPFSCREHAVPDLTALPVQTKQLQPKLGPKVRAVRPPSLEMLTEWSWFHIETLSWIIVLWLRFVCVGSDPPRHHHGNRYLAEAIFFYILMCASYLENEDNEKSKVRRPLLCRVWAQGHTGL